MMPYRFALFNCWSPEIETGPDFDIGAVPQFTELLKQSGACASNGFILDSYDVVDKQEYPTPAQEDEYDAIIISGTPVSILGPDPWIQKLIRYVRRVGTEKPHVRMLGVCFGHEVIAIAFGGVAASMGGRWELGPTRVKLTTIGKKILDTEELIIHHAHRNEVLLAPPSFHILGSTPTCYNQGMVRFRQDTSGYKLEDVQILTVQGHPEFHSKMMQFVVDLRESEEVDERVIRLARARMKAGWRHDGVSVIGRALWGIMGVCTY